MQYLDKPCISKDLSELQNMAKSPRKHGDNLLNNLSMSHEQNILLINKLLACQYCLPCLKYWDRRVLPVWISSMKSIIQTYIIFFPRASVQVPQELSDRVGLVRTFVKLVRPADPHQAPVSPEISGNSRELRSQRNYFVQVRICFGAYHFVMGHVLTI